MTSQAARLAASNSCGGGSPSTPLSEPLRGKDPDKLKKIGNAMKMLAVDNNNKSSTVNGNTTANHLHVKDQEESKVNHKERKGRLSSSNHLKQQQQNDEEDPANVRRTSNRASPREKTQLGGDSPTQKEMISAEELGYEDANKPPSTTTRRTNSRDQRRQGGRRKLLSQEGNEHGDAINAPTTPTATTPSSDSAHEVIRRARSRGGRGDPLRGSSHNSSSQHSSIRGSSSHHSSSGGNKLGYGGENENDNDSPNETNRANMRRAFSDSREQRRQSRRNIHQQVQGDGGDDGGIPSASGHRTLQRVRSRRRSADDLKGSLHSFGGSSHQQHRPQQRRSAMGEESPQAVRSSPGGGKPRTRKRGAKSGGKGTRGNYQNRVQNQIALAIQQKEEAQLESSSEEEEEEEEEPSEGSEYSFEGENDEVNEETDLGQMDSQPAVAGHGGFLAFSEAAAVSAEQAAARAAATAAAARQSAANFFTTTSSSLALGFGARHQAFEDGQGATGDGETGADQPAASGVRPAATNFFANTTTPFGFGARHQPFNEDNHGNLGEAENAGQTTNARGTIGAPTAARAPAATNFFANTTAAFTPFGFGARHQAFNDDDVPSDDETGDKQRQLNEAFNPFP